MVRAAHELDEGAGKLRCVQRPAARSTRRPMGSAIGFEQLPRQPAVTQDVIPAQDVPQGHCPPGLTLL